LPAGFSASPGFECDIGRLQDVVLECCTADDGAERCPATPDMEQM
jgi:hypothetical protein